MSKSPIVSLERVTFRYPHTKRTALNDLSLEIQARTITAILGPNGSGKTTLMRLLVGLISPQQGVVRLAGRERQAYDHRGFSRFTGLVPQDEVIPFELRVAEYVLLGRAPHLNPLEPPGPRDYAAVDEALHTAGITAFRDRPVTTLSGGERRQAMIARALAQHPQLLLMDEPTTHLDLANRSRLLDLMRALSSQAVTIIFSTHDPNAAAACADHVVLLRQGRLLESGPPQRVLTAPLLSRLYDVPVEVTKIKGRPVIMTGSPMSD
jgi:iron complex transport system ATP-binding protein